MVQNSETGSKFVQGAVLLELVHAYEDSLGVSLAFAYQDNYSVRRYSMVFLALYHLCKMRGVLSGGLGYSKFIEVISQLRSGLAVGPTDYVEWYDEYETSLVDDVVSVATTGTAEDLSIALLEHANGAELQVGCEIFRKGDEATMKKLSDKECLLIARWRLENGLFQTGDCSTGGVTVASPPLPPASLVLENPL